MCSVVVGGGICFGCGFVERGLRDGEGGTCFGCGFVERGLRDGGWVLHMYSSHVVLCCSHTMPLGFLLLLFLLVKPQVALLVVMEVTLLIVMEVQHDVSLYSSNISLIL